MLLAPFAVAPVLVPIYDDVLSRANASPWGSVEDLLRREDRYRGVRQSLSRLTASMAAADLLGVLLASDDTLRRAAAIAVGMLLLIPRQPLWGQARPSLPVIISNSDACGLIVAQEGLLEALEIRDLLGNWRETLRERAG